MVLGGWKNLLHPDLELHRIERLDDIVYCTDFQQADALTGAVLATQHDNRDMLEQLILLNPLQKIISTHAWHTYV